MPGAVSKCATCQFFDRMDDRGSDRTTSWGQCRRSAPRLHPLNVKSYMVEAAWPSVRDDDWCGEWKAGIRGVPAEPPQPAVGTRPAVKPVATARPAACAPVTPSTHLPPVPAAVRGGE